FRPLAGHGAGLAWGAWGDGPISGGGGRIKGGRPLPPGGPQAPLAQQEYAGVRIARDLANADGGVAGAPIALVTKDLTAEGDAAARVQELKAQGVQAILGSYSSSLSMPLSAQAQSRVMLHWQAG